MVLAQAPVPLQPAAGVLHDPAAGHKRESATVRGLAVASRTGEDGVTALTTLLGQVLQGCERPPGRFHGLDRCGRPAASHRYRRRVSVCGPEFFCGRQVLCSARPARCI